MNLDCRINGEASVGSSSFLLPTIDLKFVEACRDDFRARTFIKDFRSLNDS